MCSVLTGNVVLETCVVCTYNGNLIVFSTAAFAEVKFWGCDPLAPPPPEYENNTKKNRNI